MSHVVYTRPFNKDDQKERKLFLDWLYASRDKNRFDPDLFRKGQVTILTCFTSEKIVGFVPVALAYVIESLAFLPGISPEVEAQAFRAVQQHLVHCAIEKNIPDAYFVTYDEEVLKLAQRPNRGWKRVVAPLLNLHFGSLEPRNDG